MIVVSDTGPINYLVLIECVDTLPALFGQIVLPAAVESELLGPGEREAIELARKLNAELLLCDDRRARSLAEQLGVRVAGTVAVLELGAQRGLIDLPHAVRRLRSTNFHIADAVLVDILQADAKRRGR